MFRQKLRSFFEKTPVIHYIKQHETVVIGEIIIDVKNIIHTAIRLRRLPLLIHAVFAQSFRGVWLYVLQ